MVRVPAMNTDPRSSTLADRIALAVGKMSGLAFSKKCGFSDSLLRKYLEGSIPGADKLVAIADAAGVSVEWLATGRGEMRPGTAPAGTGAGIDTALMEEIARAIEAAVREEGGRIQGIALVREASRIYDDLASAYDNPANRLVGLKLAMQQFRRDIRAQASPGANSKLA